MVPASVGVCDPRGAGDPGGDPRNVGDPGGDLAVPVIPGVIPGVPVTPRVLMSRAASDPGVLVPRGMGDPRGTGDPRFLGCWCHRVEPGVSWVIWGAGDPGNSSEILLWSQ